jgi:hypothetical protein
MKKLFRSFLSLAAVFLVAVVAQPARAQVTTYTSQSAFINALTDPAYFESFNEFPGQNVASPQVFSFGPVGFSLNDNDPAGIFYSSGSPDQGSVFPSVNAAPDSFVLTFTGNVTAVGGTFFLTDLNFDSVGGFNVTATLATGENVVLMSTSSYSTQPFGGFTSTVPITSLTLTNSDGADAFVSLDNLYVSGTAAVPEPSTWALGIIGIVALVLVGRRAAKARRA